MLARLVLLVGMLAAALLLPLQAVAQDTADVPPFNGDPALFLPGTDDLPGWRPMFHLRSEQREGAEWSGLGSVNVGYTPAESTFPTGVTRPPSVRIAAQVHRSEQVASRVIGIHARGRADDDQQPWRDEPVPLPFGLSLPAVALRRTFSFERLTPEPELANVELTSLEGWLRWRNVTVHISVSPEQEGDLERFQDLLLRLDEHARQVPEAAEPFDWEGPLPGTPRPWASVLEGTDIGPGWVLQAADRSIASISLPHLGGPREQLSASYFFHWTPEAGGRLPPQFLFVTVFALPPRPAEDSGTPADGTGPPERGLELIVPDAVLIPGGSGEEGGGHAATVHVRRGSLRAIIHLATGSDDALDRAEAERIASVVAARLPAP